MESTHLANAKNGDAEAQTFLAFELINQGNLTDALDWLLKAAAQKYGMAMSTLGAAFLTGELGFEVDRERGLKFLKDAVECGFPMANVTLGLAYQAGAGVPKNSEQAVSYFKLAAEAEVPTGLSLLADALYFGIGIEADQPRALEYMEKAAVLGDPDAEYTCGGWLMEGAGGEQRIVEGVGRVMNEAGRGNVAAQNAIGTALISGQTHNGHPIRSNPSIGIYFLRLAAQQHHPLALGNLANLYSANSPIEALHLYELARAAGHPRVEEVMQELRKAVVAQGLSTDFGEYCLVWYRHELQKSKLASIEDGIAEVQKRCEADDGAAEFTMTRALERGFGLAMDVETAEVHLDRAAELNHPPALYDLAIRCLSGASGRHKSEEGMSYLKKAASLGVEEAAELLSRMTAPRT